jgi:hypothetical protein
VEEQYVSFSAAWFTLSLINAGLAQAKARSGLNWWFVSLFVGPLATLLIVAWPPGGVSTPQGMMTTRQALAIGAGVLVVGGLIGFLASGTR